jgi:hypothetical protein
MRIDPQHRRTVGGTIVQVEQQNLRRYMFYRRVLSQAENCQCTAKGMNTPQIRRQF